jgi:hypothetical protein
MAIAGINVFTDYQTKSSHKRLSLGLEYQRANFSANIKLTEGVSSISTPKILPLMFEPVLASQ